LIIDYTNDFVADTGTLTCSLPHPKMKGWETFLHGVEALNSSAGKLCHLDKHGGS